MARLIKIALTGCTLFAILAAVPACNTVKGAGRDIESGADSTERAIDRATD